MIKKLIEQKFGVTTIDKITGWESRTTTTAEYVLEGVIKKINEIIEELNVKVNNTNDRRHHWYYRADGYYCLKCYKYAALPREGGVCGA